MATKNIKPRGNGEGYIGTSVRKWLGGFFKNINVDTEAIVPTPAATDNSTKAATTAYVKSNVPASVGDTDTPVYTNSDGKVTSIGSTLFAKVVTHLLSTTAATISSLSTSSLFYRFLSQALSVAGVQYNLSNSSAWYICLGSLFGGLIIQGGVKTISFTAAGASGSMYYSTPLYPDSVFSYPITYNSFHVDSATLFHNTSYELALSKVMEKTNGVSCNYLISTKPVSTTQTAEIRYISIGI